MADGHVAYWMIDGEAYCSDRIGAGGEAGCTYSLIERAGGRRGRKRLKEVRLNFWLTWKDVVEASITVQPKFVRVEEERPRSFQGVRAECNEDQHITCFSDIFWHCPILQPLSAGIRIEGEGWRRV